MSPRHFQLVLGMGTKLTHRRLALSQPDGPDQSGSTAETDDEPVAVLRASVFGSASLATFQKV
jgi:hypothetical protein